MRDRSEPMIIHCGYSSDSDSGKSEFDEEYYRNKPPPILVHPTQKVLIRATPVGTQYGQSYQQSMSNVWSNDYVGNYNFVSAGGNGNINQDVFPALPNINYFPNAFQQTASIENEVTRPVKKKRTPKSRKPPRLQNNELSRYQQVTSAVQEGIPGTKVTRQTVNKTYESRKPPRLQKNKIGHPRGDNQETITDVHNVIYEGTSVGDSGTASLSEISFPIGKSIAVTEESGEVSFSFPVSESVAVAAESGEEIHNVADYSRDYAGNFKPSERASLLELLDATALQVDSQMSKDVQVDRTDRQVKRIASSSTIAVIETEPRVNQNDRVMSHSQPSPQPGNVGEKGRDHEKTEEGFCAALWNFLSCCC